MTIIDKSLGIGTLVGLALLTGAALFYWQGVSAEHETALGLVSEFLDVQASQLQVEEAPALDGRGVGLRATYTRPDGKAETGVFTVDTQQRYVSSADWKDCYTPTAGPGAVSHEQAQRIAQSWAEDRCVFWTEGMELERAEAFPRDDPSIYNSVWVRKGEQSQTRVIVSVSIGNGEVFGYRCRYDSELKAPKVTAAEALQTARELVDEQRAASTFLQQCAITFKDPHCVPASDESPSGGPVWEVRYRVEREGVEAIYGIHVDAITGKIVYPPVNGPP